jgi:AcrR family transcriptional regulator
VTVKSESNTQNRILDAAEALFARRGVSATSLRSITTRAGVNAAAIHYHFGSKQALVSEILTRRIAPLTKERIKRLELLEGRHRYEAIPAELLVEALVMPSAIVGREFRVELVRLASLLTWFRVGGDRESQALASPAIGVNERFAEALCHHRSLDLDEARDRIHYAMGSVAQLLRQEEITENATPTAKDLDVSRERLSRLIRFVAAGLAAPAASPFALSTPTPSDSAVFAVRGIHA